MEKFMDLILTNKIYSISVTVIMIISILVCIVLIILVKSFIKAEKYIGDVESNEDLYGEQKEFLVINWITNDMFLTRHISTFDRFITEIVKYSYKNFDEFYDTRTKIRINNIMRKNDKEKKFKQGEFEFLALNFKKDFENYKTKDYIKFIKL